MEDLRCEEKHPFGLAQILSIEDLDLNSFGKRKKKVKQRDLQSSYFPDVFNFNKPASINSEEDYTYDELLTRAFNLMKANSSKSQRGGGPKKLVMRPPQVVIRGAKTALVNFEEIIKKFHREPSHLVAFISVELGAQGVLNGCNQLIVKGRFRQKHFANLLQRYFKGYVICTACKGSETVLIKEDRITFVTCMNCGSRHSVAPIKMNNRT